MTLNEEQSRAVAAQPGEPIRLVDPVTHRGYVLVSADVYERIRDLLADDPRDAYTAVDRAFADGWNDPKMDEYDRYDELRK